MHIRCRAFEEAPVDLCELSPHLPKRQIASMSISGKSHLDSSDMGIQGHFHSSRGTSARQAAAKPGSHKCAAIETRHEPPNLLSSVELQKNGAAPSVNVSDGDFPGWQASHHHPGNTTSFCLIKMATRPRVELEAHPLGNVFLRQTIQSGRHIARF